MSTEALERATRDGRAEWLGNVAHDRRSDMRAGWRATLFSPFAVALLVLGFGADAAGTSLEAQDVDSTAAAVDQFFRWADGTTPGCAVGVERGGKPVLTRAYGMANLAVHTPFTTETVADAGSVSKQFTAAALLLLVQDGKVRLDDDIRRFIPEMPDYGTPILVRHLLSHTSGIRESDILAALNGWGIESAAYSNTDILEMASRQKALNFPPGSEYEYSNTNFFLAATIVRRVSGITLAEFTKRRLFDPLGMSKTRWRENPAPVVDGMAAGYQSDAQGRIRELRWPDYTNGAGGLQSTVPDLLKWNEALRRGGVIPRSVVTLMETRPRLSGGGSPRYGFGLSVDSYHGVAEIGHGGIWAGYRAFIARYPEQALSVAVLCNDRSRDAAGLAHDVANLFLPRNPAPPAQTSTRTAVPLSPGQLNAAAGLYRITKSQEAVRLSVKDGGWESSGDQYFGGGRLVPESATTFRFGDVVSGTFGLDSRGEVHGIRMWVNRVGADTIVYERVEEWKLTPRDTSAISGRYSSDETGTLTVAARNGQLLVATRPARWMAAVPVYREALEIPGLGVLVFRRDNDGNVTGLTFTNLTARNIVYVKH